MKLGKRLCIFTFKHLPQNQNIFFDEQLFSTLTTQGKAINVHFCAKRSFYFIYEIKITDPMLVKLGISCIISKTIKACI